MRHGEAVDAGARADADRWLTPQGRRVTRDVARWLAAHHPPLTVRCSPLVRAVQTAEIVLGACDLTSLTVMRELATGDVPALLAAATAFEGPGPLCLVGHEPTLGELVARMLRLPGAPDVAKSSVLALDRAADGAFAFAWRLDPLRLRAEVTP